MKTLIVVRHAKSDWSSSGMQDHDRPLNSRGKKDAPEMAKRLIRKEIAIDLFLTSTALRAYTTASFFAEEYKAHNKQLMQDAKLYLAEPNTFFKVLLAVSDEYKSVALFSHNPGITTFVNSLSSVRVDDMPTCAVYAVTANIDSWAAFKDAPKTFLLFDYPKNG